MKKWLVTDLEFALILLPFNFASGEVEPGPATQGWRDSLLTAVFHLFFNKMHRCPKDKTNRRKKHRHEKEVL